MVQVLTNVMVLIILQYINVSNQYMYAWNFHKVTCQLYHNLKKENTQKLILKEKLIPKWTSGIEDYSVFVPVQHDWSQGLFNMIWSFPLVWKDEVTTWAFCF